MIDQLSKIFTAWEPLLKARPTKDLDQHQRLAHIGEKLQGKKAKNLAFTTAYPGQEGQRKHLGTVDGNQQFLLGYANPKFHLAPYHWQVIDPSLSDEEAEKLHTTVGHPSKPELWTWGEIDDEGDVEDGVPHDDIKEQYDAKRESDARNAEAIDVRSGTGSYKAIPSEGMVYGLHNDHKYKWAMIRNSHFAAVNPELFEAMEASFEMEKSHRRLRGTPTEGCEDLEAAPWWAGKGTQL